MTNADKYLKDGVDGIAPLLNEFRNIGAIDSGREYRIDQLLRAEVKPTLSEDEKVILRNIEICTYIGRNDNGELYVGKRNENKKDKNLWYELHS